MTHPTELTKGVRFQSTRADEGIVTVVCDYGKCVHDTSRDEAVHVRGGPYGELLPTMTEFFINLPSNYPIEEWGAEVVA